MPALLHLAAAWALAFLVVTASAQQPAPVVRNRDGIVLKHPKIIEFDGEFFSVAHDEGIARVHWNNVPENLRQGFTLDLERAAATKMKREDLAKAAAARQPAPSEVSPPEAPAPPTIYTDEKSARAIRDNVCRVEVHVPLMSRSDLSKLQGPNALMTVQSVNALEITFRLQEGDWRTVPFKDGFGDALTLLFDDGHGCSTYFLNRTSRDPNDVILLFEHRADSASRPKDMLPGYTVLSPTTP